MTNPKDLRDAINLGDLIGKDENGTFRCETIDNLTKDQAITCLINELTHLSHVNSQLKAFIVASCNAEDASVSVVRGTGIPDTLVHRLPDGTVQSVAALSLSNFSQS